MENYFIITISRVSSFIGEILGKFRRDVFKKTRTLYKKTRFYPIPMGFTTVGQIHVYHVDKAQLD